MALEELLQLLAKREAVEAKQAEAMRLFVLAAAQSLASGDPEFAATAARGEALALEMIRGAAESLGKLARMAAEYAAAPDGGDDIADAMRRRAASAAALAESAEELAAFLRSAGALPAADVAPSDSGDSDSDSSSSFSPEWAN